MFLKIFPPKILQNTFGRYIFIYLWALASLQSNDLKHTRNQKEFLKRQQKRNIHWMNLDSMLIIWQKHN